MKKLAIQMDAVERLNPRSDTTLLLGREALRRGYELYYYLPKDLSFHSGEVTAKGRKLILRDDPKDYYTVGELQTLNLHEMDVVLLRQEPPFDMEYITSTFLLEKLQPDVQVVNDPFHVRNAPEKWFMFDFPQFVPPTLISHDVEAIEHFLNEHGEIILKPLYGFAGHAVFHIKQGDSNFHALLEMFFAGSGEPVIAQRFLPEIRNMDKRVIVIDGKVTAILGRVPAQDDIRANMRVGGTGVKAPTNERDILIGETVGAELKKRGILLAGLDIIGDYLTEINITCPTGLIKSNELYGIQQERIFWDAVEEKLK
ncbi:MAG TPA: glutathione synthase [Rickettsiales bacterium]|nr:glutathione synthase [Rickettsiales bacterium]